MANFAGGSGTENDPYLISNKQEFHNMNDHLIDNHFKLIDDIDFSGDDFTPIGEDNSCFRSCFDGDGHTVSNITIDELNLTEDQVPCMFLFDDHIDEMTASKGYLKNLKINNITIDNYSANNKSFNDGSFFIGGYFEALYSDWEIINIQIKNATLNFSDETSVDDFGGLFHSINCDDNFELLIEDCKIEITANFKKDQEVFGGLAAFTDIYGESKMTINNCNFNVIQNDGGIPEGKHGFNQGLIFGYARIYQDAELLISNTTGEGKLFAKSFYSGTGAIEIYGENSFLKFEKCFIKIDLEQKYYSDYPRYCGGFAAVLDQESSRERESVLFENCGIVGTWDQPDLCSEGGYAFGGFSGGISFSENSMVYRNCYSAMEMNFLDQDHVEFSKFVPSSIKVADSQEELHIIENCYYDNDIISESGEEWSWNDELGISKTTEEMKSEETYTDWNFGEQPSELSNNYNDGYPALEGTVNGIWWLPVAADGQLNFIEIPQTKIEYPKANRVIVKSDTAEWTETADDVSEDNVVERTVEIEEGDKSVCRQVAKKLLQRWGRENKSITGNILLFVNLEFTEKAKLIIEDSMIDDFFVVQSLEHDIINQETTIKAGDIVLDDNELLARILDEIGG